MNRQIFEAVKNHVLQEHAKIGVIRHTFDPTTQEAKVGKPELKAYLVYKVNTWPAYRAVLENPVSKTNKKEH